MAYVNSGISSNSNSHFAWEVFYLLSTKYTITLTTTGNGLYQLPGSPFGTRSLFSDRAKYGYLPKPISISGKSLFLSKDWYTNHNALCIYDNLKYYVSSLTSGRYLVQNDSMIGGDKFVLYEFI